MTFVFKTASHGCQLCGRVTGWLPVGFHQVFESKSESLVIPLCLAFCTLRFVIRLRRQGFGEKARSTLFHFAAVAAKRTVRKERLFSCYFLYDSTYVRVCQGCGGEICDLNSLGGRNCAELIIVLSVLCGFQSGLITK